MVIVLLSMEMCFFELSLCGFDVSMLLGWIVSLYYLKCVVRFIGLRIFNLYLLFGFLMIGMEWVGMIVMEGVVLVVFLGERKFVSLMLSVVVRCYSMVMVGLVRLCLICESMDLDMFVCCDSLLSDSLCVWCSVCSLVLMVGGLLVRILVVGVCVIGWYFVNWINYLIYWICLIYWLM